DAWEQLLAAPADPALAANLSQSKWLRAIVLFGLLRLARVGAWGLLKFRATGQGRLPRPGPFILSANHQAYVDAGFLCALLPLGLLRRFFAVGAAEYFQSPMSGRIARALNIVPVDPDANLISAMQAGATGLRLKKVLVLFPEGERSID